MKEGAQSGIQMGGLIGQIIEQCRTMNIRVQGWAGLPESAFAVSTGKFTRNP